MRLEVDDPIEAKRLILRRKRAGGDRFDEVWDGIYIMSPVADNEHQKLSTRLTTAIDSVMGDRDGVDVLGGGTNVTDRSEKWRKNYRVPDVAVFLPGNPAVNRKTHWVGGPDFAIEVISPNDRSREKFEFYAKVGVRELLIVDRHPWRLELHRCNHGRFEMIGTSEVTDSNEIACLLIDVTFRLVPGRTRPRIEVRCPADGRTWLA